MSFSSDVKKELAKQAGKARHCQLAELSAIVSFSGKLSRVDGGLRLTIDSSNAALQEKYHLLLQQLFQTKNPEALTILESIKMWDVPKNCLKSLDLTDGLLIQQSCCRRAFIRGAFLACGSVSNPQKAYHFEIVCGTKGKARQLSNVMQSFGVDARIVERKNHQVVYVKEGAHIVDLLNIMEAHVALMNLENVRIVKEMRNFVNRQVNCETANINKTVSAAVRQVEDILFIKNTKGLESLPKHLREVAGLRLEYPDVSLKELGTYLDPPVGKSGVNHRLRRISEIAAGIDLER